MFVAVSENALVSELVSIGLFAQVLQKQQPAQPIEVVRDEIGGGCENRTHDRSFAVSQSMFAVVCQRSHKSLCLQTLADSTVRC
jgi:hypothetical protein